MLVMVAVPDEFIPISTWLSPDTCPAAFIHKKMERLVFTRSPTTPLTSIQFSFDFSNWAKGVNSVCAPTNKVSQTVVSAIILCVAS